MSDFSDIANDFATGQSANTPSTFADIANDFGLPKPVKPSKKAQIAPDFQFEDAAEFRKKLAASTAPDAAQTLAEFDKQYSTVAPKQQAQPQQPPPGWTTGGQPTPSNPNGWKPIPTPDDPWWKKVIGAGEAGLTALSGATTGTLGGVLSTADNIVKHAGYAAVGDWEAAKKLPTYEQALAQGQSAGTYQPRTQSGRDYVEDVVAPVGQALMAVAPLPETATLMGQIPTARRAVSDPLQAAIDRARNGQAGQPRVEPTLGGQPASTGAAPTTPQAIEAAVTPALSKATPELQAAVADLKAKGIPVNKEVLGRHVEAETLPVPMKLSEGQSTLDPALVSQEMNGRGKGGPIDPNFYNVQGKQLVQNAKAIRDIAAPDVPTTNATETGQLLVDRYKAMDEPIRADINAKYKALSDANGGELPLSGHDFVTAADAALKKAGRARFLPSEVNGILDDLRDGGPMTFNDFENYRTILAEQARKADRAGDGTASYAVGVVRDALESLPMSNETAAIKPLADAARQAAKARFDAIKKDPAYKAAVNDDAPMGEPSPLADKFVGGYVIGGKAANIKQMKANLGNDPIANQAISAGVIDHLTNRAGADLETGKFSQAGWNRTLKADIEPKINDLLDPQSAQYVKQLGNVAKYTEVAPKGSYVNSSNTFTAQAAEAAKGALEGAANVAAHGVPVGTWARKAMAGRANAKAAKASIAPGAGLTRGSDFPGIKTEPE